MSLPIARARRKKVPSSQRSPCSSTLSHSRTESSKPSVVMSQASCSSRDLPLVLDQAQLGEHPGEVLVAAVVAGDQRVDARVDAAQHARLRRSPPRRSARSSRWRVSMPSESEISFSDGRRPTHSSPYCRSRKNSSVSRELRGPRVEHRLAVLDHQHGVAGLVAGEVGVRGLGAEPVVGVVGAHLEAAGRDDQPLAGELLAQPLAAGLRPRGDRVRRARRARGRPSRCA